MKPRIFVGLCLCGILAMQLLFAHSNVYSQTSIAESVEITSIDVSNFPTVRLAVGVWDRIGRHTSKLNLEDFEIIEDDNIPSAPDLVVAEESAPILVSVVIDVAKSTSGEKERMVRHILCDLMPNQFGMNQAENPDRVEVWTLNSNAQAALGATSDSGALCGWSNNLWQPSSARDGSLNTILAKLLSRGQEQRGQMILVISGSKMTQSDMQDEPLFKIRTQNLSYPVYVLSLLDDSLVDEWNFLEKLCSRDSQGTPIITRTGNINPLDAKMVEDDLARVLRDKANYKNQYVVQYTSVLPRSESTHKLRVQVKELESESKNFSTYTSQSGDPQINLVPWIGTLLIFMFLSLTLAYALYYNLHKFTYP